MHYRPAEAIDETVKDAIGMHYSAKPLELRARSMQLHRMGYHNSAEHAMRASEQLVPAHHDNSNRNSNSNSNHPMSVVTACDLTDPHTRFASFRTPAYGLMSQRTEFIGFAAIAQALNR